MTTDYEKKNKEFLEGVKKIHSGIKEVLAELGNSNLPLANILNEAVWALNKQFPELAESEDERIREELKEAFKAYDIESKWNGIPIRSIFDWLEKQKENPKSADSIPSDCVSDVKCEDRSPKHTDSFGTDIRDTPAYWRGWDDAMKQKEQEHPNGCFTCDEYKKGYEAGRFHGFTAGYNKAMKEQKPADWSEEDEKIITALAKALIGSDSAEKIMLFDGVTIEMVSNWLKSLRPQPHWNPSEEQMEALEYVIRDYREDSCNATANYLQEILDHLKNM